MQSVLLFLLPQTTSCFVLGPTGEHYCKRAEVCLRQHNLADTWLHNRCCHAAGSERLCSTARCSLLSLCYFVWLRTFCCALQDLFTVEVICALALGCIAVNEQSLVPESWQAKLVAKPYMLLVDTCCQDRVLVSC